MRCIKLDESEDQTRIENFDFSQNLITFTQRWLAAFAGGRILPY